MVKSDLYKIYLFLKKIKIAQNPRFQAIFGGADDRGRTGTGIASHGILYLFHKRFFQGLFSQIVIDSGFCLRKNIIIKFVLNMIPYNVADRTKLPKAKKYVPSRISVLHSHIVRHA